MGMNSSNDNNKLLIEKICEISQSLCEAEGFEFVHAEFAVQGGHKILRIYIDKEGGVNISDCADISRELSDLLDVKIDIPGKYNLEVSSPGLNRPLVKPDHFAKFRGEKAHIKTVGPLEPESDRKKFKGVIRSSDNESVVIEIDQGEITIPFEKIQSARLNPDT